MKFLTIFKVAATGCNYIGYVKWTCSHLRLGTAWYDDELQAMMKGARKFSLRCGVTSAVGRQLLTDTLMAQLILLAA